MPRQWWYDDDRLLAALGEALGSARGVPARFTEMGRAAYAWHGVDAELATLTYDSVSTGDWAVLAASRAEPASLRNLTFTSGDLTIELELATDCLLGQLVPPQPGWIQARTATGDAVTAAIDQVGGFAIRPVPRGSFRLHCHTEAGADVLTGWITVPDPAED